MQCNHEPIPVTSTRTPATHSHQFVLIDAITTTMSDQQPSNAFIDAVVSVFSFLASIRWSLRISQLFSIVYSIAYFPFRLVLYPLTIIVNILLVLFAPAIYAGSFIFSIIQSIFAFFASLEVRRPWRPVIFFVQN